MLVLVILGLIWASVLIPPYLQNRRESRPGDSIASFRHQLSVLERATPGAGPSNLARLDVGRYDVPRYDPRSNVAQLAAAARPAARAVAAAMRRAEVRRRRRDVFLTLLGAVGVTFLLAVALGGSVWMLHLARRRRLRRLRRPAREPPAADRREGAQGAVPAPHRGPPPGAAAARRAPLRQLTPRRLVFGSAVAAR